MSWTSAQLLEAFLTTTSDQIIPLTAKGVSSGCKVFGAAIFRKSDLTVVNFATNDETSSPLLHGEINCIQQFYALPKDQRPSTKDCIFFSTHEPCSLCLSGITWSGFDNINFLFTYEDTKDTFNIPHDIKILEEVFKVPSVNISESSAELSERPLYNKSNSFWKAKSVSELVNDLSGQEQIDMQQKVQEIKQKYNDLSSVYQDSKEDSDIPLS
ncbi:uncharacterized protein IL334_000380 [Kwoniella shivajii]|uniref:CMP/dCMP-type deaminase domain-containing protein n=1 Tax=Kwoniella shivajii TaxID=564305 RepID=A0ABZ1CP02_9TREE|nr:hypothetical protein IL334_000380 [Kwoniella shivajii]